MMPDSFDEHSKGLGDNKFMAEIKNQLPQIKMQFGVIFEQIENSKLLWTPDFSNAVCSLSEVVIN